MKWGIIKGKCEAMYNVHRCFILGIGSRILVTKSISLKFMKMSNSAHKNMFLKIFFYTCLRLVENHSSLNMHLSIQA